MDEHVLSEDVSIRMAALDAALQMMRNDAFDVDRLIRGASIIVHFLKTGNAPEKDHNDA